MSGESYLNYEFEILFADDQKFMLKNLERYFKKFVKVALATTVDEAKKILETKKIAVIISDHQMADGHGIEALEFILDRFPQIRRIILTADRHEETVMELISKKLAQAIVYKPLVKEQLEVVVRNQVNEFIEETKSI
ncbi:MAG: response regulator [Candidatus Heimdallarchaeota archaeon]|nr:response regulator [Candidatus Heimdallarchaeota archaeon]MDH5644885.1 response regulator [Candidatus Heimdallarchaeota archaeon]